MVKKKPTGERAPRQLRRVSPTEQLVTEVVATGGVLENGSSWIVMSYDDALRPASLTAAFMADRYHTLREVKRQISNLRTAA